MYYENIDLENIITPVDADKLEILLNESGFNADKTEYLVKGFKEGFELHYEGNLKGKVTSQNLKFRIGTKTQLWNKVMLEVKDKRFAGPFVEPPFEEFVQSPIGLVPKDKGTKTRLIFHLSFPRDGDSVNSGIPEHYCSVQYPDFDHAVKICLMAGKGCKMSKSDMSRAFRNVPMKRNQWKYLVMMAEHPLTGRKFYFVDKCLPFGSSISCAIFQGFSDAIAHVVTFRTQRDNLNYLDDFFFAAITKLLCDGQVKEFLDICKAINFPVALEKTFWSATRLVFLGLLLDSELQVVCIPEDKIMKAKELIGRFLSKKKVTVLEVQQLCGFLNFLGRALVPGRTFIRRLYPLVKNNMRQHHHVRLTKENHLDLMMWQRFLGRPESYARSFMDFGVISSSEIDMYSDASRNHNLGFGAYCGTEWTFGKWESTFMIRYEPSIEYLELFGVTVAVMNWIKLFKNKRMILFCDNEAMVHMINNSSSSCKNCIVLIRLIVLEGLVYNVKINAKHVGTKQNGKADALSRLDFKRFRKLGPTMNKTATPIPVQLWPISKIWMY